MALDKSDIPAEKLAAELRIMTASFSWQGDQTRELQVLSEAADEIDRLRNEVSDLRAFGELARDHAKKILGQQ